MPLNVEPRPLSTAGARSAAPRHGDGHSIVIGLLNNMPDSALEATEGQFSALLEAVAGPMTVRLRFSCLAGVPRGAAATERVEGSYWGLKELLAERPDALIVTGTEPKAPQLTEEPYWGSFVEVLEWAENNTVSSIWSCLAAHAAVEALDGIQRQRLAQKRFGVFAHGVAAGHPLVRGIAAPLRTPHSRWNDLPVALLGSSGYAIVSSSSDSGADLFVKQRRSQCVFLQGHPEYERTTLFKEYRRDVGRFLSGQQSTYPPLPQEYFAADAAAALRAFQERAVTQRTIDLMSEFPSAAAQGAQSTWRPAALQIYRNWLAYIANAKGVAGAPLLAQV
jgi:homoserine O-succinyltransferase/O-acetyltransferase